MERYTLRKEQKPWVWAAAGLTALLTLITCIMIAAGETSRIAMKVSWTTFVLFWCGIPAYSGAKWLKRNSPLYGLGIATIAVSIKALVIFVVMVFGESNSSGFAKYCMVLLAAAATLGYICGIVTIRITHSSIYYLKLAACCCVAVIGLYYIIMVLKLRFYDGFDIQYMVQILFTNEKSGRILGTLLLLSLSFTCIAKSVSRTHEQEVPYEHI